MPARKEVCGIICIDSPAIMPKGGIVQFRNDQRDIQISCNCNHVTNLSS